MSNLKLLLPMLGLLFIVNTVSSQTTPKTTIEEFTVDGLKVILKPATNEVISLKLFIQGGTENYRKSQEGIEALALAIASEGGTKNYSKEVFLGTLERFGSSIGASTTYDYATFTLRCVVRSWDETWKLYADAVMNPTFLEKEFNLSRDQLITGVKQSEGNPDSKLRDLAMADVFDQHNYSKKPNGSVESLEKLTLEDITSYYGHLINKSRSILVVVGKVSKEDITKKIKEGFEGMKQGKYDQQVYRPLNIKVSSIKYETSDIATNYIRGIMNGPDIKSDDAIAMRVAFSIFRDRLFEEIRTKRNLSYAPSAFFSTNRTTYSGVYVSTTDPDSALKVMLREIKKVKKEGFEKSELENKKGQFLTGFYMGQETNSSQATSLGVNEMRKGWENTLIFVDNVYSLSLGDINRVFDKYTKAIKWYYLGNEEQLPKTIHLEKKINRPY